MCRFPVNCRSQWNIIIVPARIKLKSPLNTQEAVQIVRATWRRLVKARINDCHRRLKRYENKHNYTTNWNIWYLLTYLTLLRLLPTNEPTRRLNVPILDINRRLCLGNGSYLSRLRITSEVELLPPYNQRHYMTATWLKTNWCTETTKKQW